MIKTLYRPKRWRNGKRVVSRLYSAKIRVAGERRISCIALGVSDRQVAEEKARQIVQEREKELAGLLPPKSQREAAQASLAKQIQEFTGDLKAKGRNSQYIDETENKLELLSAECGWRCLKDVTAGAFIAWRSRQKKSPKTLNEYLASAKGFLNWMVKPQGRLAANPLASVGKVETRGREVRPRRAYADDELQALLNVAGKYRLPCLMSALTGIRHGELSELCWGDLNLSAEKPSVLVRASVSKNHKQACLPLHPALLAELAAFRPADASAGDMVFAGRMPHSVAFNALLKKAGITKRDTQGRVVDFHSLRHTFCTNLHRAGVSQREAMELMRHNDPRLTATTYTDTSLLSLRSAVQKIGFSPSPIASLFSGAEGHSLSQPVAKPASVKSDKSPVNKEGMSLFGAACLVLSNIEKWCAIQGSNL